MVSSHTQRLDALDTGVMEVGQRTAGIEERMDKLEGTIQEVLAEGMEAEKFGRKIYGQRR